MRRNWMWGVSKYRDIYIYIIYVNGLYLTTWCSRGPTCMRVHVFACLLAFAWPCLWLVFALNQWCSLEDKVITSSGGCDSEVYYVKHYIRWWPIFKIIGKFCFEETKTVMFLFCCNVNPECQLSGHGSNLSLTGSFRLWVWLSSNLQSLPESPLSFWFSHLSLQIPCTRL